jgi:hypothetical protein
VEDEVYPEASLLGSAVDCEEKVCFTGCFSCDADVVDIGIRTAPEVFVDCARAVVVDGGATLLGTRTAPVDARFVFCATSSSQ